MKAKERLVFSRNGIPLVACSFAYFELDTLYVVYLPPNRLDSFTLPSHSAFEFPISSDPSPVFSSSSVECSTASKPTFPAMDRHHRQPERLIFNHALNEDWLQQHHAVRSYQMSPQLSSSSSYGSTSSSYMSTSPTTQYHSTDVRHPSYGHARQHNSGYGLDLCVSPIDLHNDRHGASNSIR